MLVELKNRDIAKHRKKTHQAKSAGNAEDMAADPTASPNPAQIHSFSRTIAKEHGEKAAVLLQYLAHHVARSKNDHGGRKWFYKTLDDLAVMFPYIKRSTVHDTLKSLKDKGLLRIGDFNKTGYDRTCWYAFADDNVRKVAQSSKPVYFRVEDAVQYGIVAAVLLGNLEYWILENRKEDPGYTWHSMSPRELAKHLPFPKTTLQRALADLVKAGVLRAKEPEVNGGTTQYALADEKRLADEKGGGPKLDMVGGPNPDEGGPVSDMGDPKSDMPGPNPDMGGPNPDNNTILIENPLKEPCLKEPSYVDAALPTTISNSSKTDKLKQVKSVNPFLAPVFKSGKGTDSESLQVSDQAPNLQKSSTARESPELSSLSSSSSSIPTSSPSAPTSESDRYTSGPKSHTRVKLSVSLEDGFFTYSKMVSKAGEGGVYAAKLALQWISLFLQQAKPEELIEVLKITEQKALYDKLAALFTPHLAKHLEPFLENQKELDKVQVISKLVMQFLTQGFCRFDDDLYYSLGTPYPNRVCMMLYEKLQPYFDAREEEQRQKHKDSQTQILKDRSLQYKSPDKLKESRADISAAEKVQVLRNALMEINNIGAFNDKNQLTHQVVEYNKRTFDAAYAFFQANPDFTVAHLIAVVEKCLELPKERDYREEGNDPLWHARKAKDISFLIQHLDIIIQSLNCVDEIAHFQPLPPGTLFKKSSKSSLTTETEDG
jgi:predicted transcriptional regulator